MIVGRVRSLHRYPVKSLVGEDLSRAALDHRGLLGDRLWSVRDEDGKFGSGKSTRRFRRMDGLLDLVATYDGEVPVIQLPDGTTVHGPGADTDAALSTHVGRPVSLAREGDVSHFDDGPVHVITTSTLHALEQRHGRPVDARRLRPNLVVDTSDVGFVEDGWVGREIGIVVQGEGYDEDSLVVNGFWGDIDSDSFHHDHQEEYHEVVEAYAAIIRENTW